MKLFDMISDGVKLPVVVSENDYFMATVADFDLSSKYEYASIDSKEFISDSGSRYKIQNGILYRCSNHWGMVASCRWFLPAAYIRNGFTYIKKGEREIWLGINPFLYGKVNLSDMKRSEYVC